MLAEKWKNYGIMLAIMRRFCKECRAEGKHRLHTMMGGEDCADCCVPGVITRGMEERSITLADDEERNFFANVALRQIANRLDKECELNDRKIIESSDGFDIIEYRGKRYKRIKSEKEQCDKCCFCVGSYYCKKPACLTELTTKEEYQKYGEIGVGECRNYYYEEQKEEN